MTYFHFLSSSSVWHAPLGVRSAKRRHQSPKWTILSHSYCLIQWEIVRSQVLLDSLHPRGSRTSWWSPPVLWRGSSYDTPGICLVWHSRIVAEQRKTQCLDNSRQAWLHVSTGSLQQLVAFTCDFMNNKQVCRCLQETWGLTISPWIRR